ncbi:MAG: hypothetical protein KDB61_02095 [Planctomycetes bacterium]|nr:hypothetical protein [Planctomycetota bacterium]
MSQRLPQTHALLERFRRRLLRLSLQQEVGMAAFFTSAWLCLIYGLDAILHLPGPVRILHAVVLTALPVWFVVHRLRRHWAQIPDTAGLAVLLERGSTDGQDLLVSAVQLAQDPAFQERGEFEILQRCEERAKTLTLDPVLEPQPARRWMWAGGVAALLLVPLYLTTQSTADIFVARMLGADIPWPQKTFLDIDIPGRADRMFVEREGDRIRVRVARGSDVPILVRATGDIPSQVFLVFDHGHRSVLESGGSELFRSQLRSVQQDMVFHATGGDDSDRRPEVTLEVLDPPDVGGLAFHVVPPAYSGLPERWSFGTDVEVLAQSQVQVHVLPDMDGVTGKAMVLPSGDELELQPAAFPIEAGSDQKPEREGLTFAWRAEDSVRFRLELLSPSGLLNPDPGLYAMQTVEDARPVLSVLAPGRVDMEVVSGGFLPLRVRAQDDFGLEPARYALIEGTGDPADAPTLELEWTALAARDLDASDPKGPAGLGRRLLAVDELSPTGSVTEGMVFTLQFSVEDNREPAPQVSRSGQIRVRVLSGDDYLRKLETRLAQAGEKAGRMAQLLEQTMTQMRHMQTALGGDGADGDVDLREPLFDVERLSGNGRDLARDLAGLCESLLYSRLDGRAEPLMRAMDASLSAQLDRSFDPAPWQRLALDYEQGTLGQAGLGADLLQLVELSLQVSEQHTNRLADALKNGAGLPAAEALTLAYGEAQGAQEAIERLLTRLGEWDNFQSVLTLTRDIIKRQRNVRERTKKFAEEK